MAGVIKDSTPPAETRRVATLASAPARLAGSAVLACQSDERLAALVRDGHERAFEALVSRYRAPLIRYCRRILPESRAEDAVQQAFINAHTALTRSDEPAEIKAWLYRIARNASLNMLRQNGWNYEEIPLDFDGVRRPDQVVEQRIQLQDTVAAVNDLPERQRTALVMREFEGRSYAEIAAELGGGDGAVRQLLNRARVSLRAAATMLTPPPLLFRLATSTPGDGSGGGRAAEILGGLGAATVAKAGATALIAGSLVVGAVNTPLPIIGNGGTRENTAAAAQQARKAGAQAPDTGGGAATPVAAGAGDTGLTHGVNRAGQNMSGNSGGQGLRNQRGSDPHGLNGSGDDPGAKHDSTPAPGSVPASEPDHPEDPAPVASEADHPVEPAPVPEPVVPDDKSGKSPAKPSDDPVPGIPPPPES
jgi:RNA polymerase sigma factor (sigma-70 family)